jgi:hypothetical protein
MMWIRLRLASTATVCVVVYIIGGLFAPTIALACEGSGEEKAQLIRITPIAWNGRVERCAEKGSDVNFSSLRQRCEYEVKNENAAEEVTVERDGPIRFSLGGECETLKCVVFQNTERAPECRTGVRLRRTEKCYALLEYVGLLMVGNKEETKYPVETKSERRNVATTEVSQLVEI